jgi:uncharacterized protein (DUF4415 family)
MACPTWFDPRIRSRVRTGQARATAPYFVQSSNASPLTRAKALSCVIRIELLGDDSHIDYSDIPPLTDEQLAAMTRFRDVRDRLEKKKMISLYVRGDVLEWLKSKGPGHLTRINDILTSVMEAERRIKKSA